MEVLKFRSALIYGLILTAGVSFYLECQPLWDPSNKVTPPFLRNENFNKKFMTRSRGIGVYYGGTKGMEFTILYT